MEQETTKQRNRRWKKGFRKEHAEMNKVIRADERERIRKAVEEFQKDYEDDPFAKRNNSEYILKRVLDLFQ